MMNKSTGACRKKRYVIRTSILFALLSLAVRGVPAQSNGTQQGFNTSPPAGAGFPSATGLFGTEVPRAAVSGRIAAWNPEDNNGMIAVRYVYPEGYHQIDDPDFFTLQALPAPGVVFGSPLKARPVVKDGLAEYFGETTVVLEFRISPDTSQAVLRVNALFQICNDQGTCLFPDSEALEILFDSAAPRMEPDAVVREVIEWSSGSEMSGGAAGTTGLPAASRPPVPVPRMLLFLLMALAGGILLNVMPCVLPLLSVKALGLVKQAGQDPREILKHSWLYVAGIEVSFWVMALVVVLLQASGRLLGWGFQFQSPAFVLVLTALIWVFALSMFDVFVIEAPRTGVKGASAAGARGGYAGSFLTGIFAVLVATPCTAPFLGPALGFAFSQSPLVIFAVFSAAGLGLGLPFLLLGIRPGIIGRLPRPGEWMNTFKEVMGFLLIGTAVYLFTTFVRLAPQALNGTLWWLLLLGLSAWLLGRARRPLAPKWFRIAGQAAALALAVGSGILLIDLPGRPVAGVVMPVGSDAAAPGSSAYGGSETIAFDENDVRNRIAAGEPVFLEFTAAWCTTCKVNQRVINHPDVRTLMQDQKVVHIIGDLTSYDPTLTRWLADFGRAGVPLYVLYRPGEAPHLFPELISVDGLVRELGKISSPAG